MLKALLIHATFLRTVFGFAADGAILSKSAPTNVAIVHAGAVASDGSIYFGSRAKTYGTGAGVYRYSGGVLSRFSESADDVDACPAIATDGTVYYTSLDGRLRALSPSGSIKWTFGTGGFLASTPAIGSDGTVYLGGSDKRFRAISPSGVEKWSFSTADWIESSPAVGADGTIFFGSWDGTVYALTPSGTQKWRVSLGAPILSSPAIVTSGTVYIATRNGRVFGLRGSDGYKIYETNVGSPIEAGIAIGTTDAFVPTLGGELVSIRGGAVRWRAALGAPGYTTPTVRADGSILVAAGKRLLCFNSSGSQVWAASLDAEIDSSPVIASDKSIYVGCHDGRVYKIESAAALAPSSWPQFHGDNYRTGTVAAVSSQILALQSMSGTANAVQGAGDLVANEASTVQVDSNNVTSPPASPGTGEVSGNTSSTDAGRIINLSVRAQVGTGENVAIAGVGIRGSGSKTLLVRAVGMGLREFGLVDILNSPQLTLVGADGQQITQVGAWNGDAGLESTFARVGAFPLKKGSSDSALTLTLQAGTYTAIASGSGTDTGIALLEAYDADPSPSMTTQLSNISCRAYVGSGAESLIAGIVIGGNTPINVLVRAVGPSLGQFGINGLLEDPEVEVHRSTNPGDEILASNDNWGTSSDVQILKSTMAQVGAFAIHESSKDSVLLIRLQPGVYTVHVRGKNNAKGIALIELYSF